MYCLIAVLALLQEHPLSAASLIGIQLEVDSLFPPTHIAPLSSSHTQTPSQFLNQKQKSFKISRKVLFHDLSEEGLSALITLVIHLVINGKLAVNYICNMYHVKSVSNTEIDLVSFSPRLDL